MRNITIYMPHDMDHIELANLSKEVDIPLDQMFQAIGYLSQWAMTGYEQVSIAISDDGDMTARYWGKDKHYVIGAVWNDTTRQYDFHS